VVNAGELPESKPSTVIDLSGKEPIIVREGAVAAPDVWDAIREQY
jgi:tRNA A37 threonylcarbamoyladenosine synthetase subunit TsaC/SUA5/YrdC